MAGTSVRAAGLVALLAIVLYQTALRDVFVKLGMGRTIQPLSDFPYDCRRIEHDEIQNCEDIWLDEDNRQLYLACSSVAAGDAWVPTLGRLNASGRAMNDAVYVMDLNKPVGRSYQYRRIATPDFRGTVGEGSIHLLGMSGRKTPGRSKVEIYLVNNKPSLQDPIAGTPDLANNAETGSNATIELFEIETGSSSMRHVRTFSHPLIATPNNVAPMVDGSGFYITNDHGLAKTGFKNIVSAVIFNGNVVYCTNPPRASTAAPTCKIVAQGLSFPNGLVIHPLDPKTLYVPSTALDKGIAIFKIHPTDGSLTKLDNLAIPYSLDNLSPGADGSIYAAAFPKFFQSVHHLSDPATFDKTIAVADRKVPPATILKISKVRNLVNDGREVTWVWEKVLEDAVGLTLPATTVAVKDTKTGNLFLSGEYKQLMFS